MIKVEWRARFEGIYGEDRLTVYFSEVPRVPRVGDYVDDFEVTRVEWSENMQSAIIELRG